jgi:hypothetical protein
MLGKVVGGVTSTVNKVADTLVQTADSISKDFRDKLPLGEIAGKVEGFAVAINTTKSEILALAQDPKQILLNKIDNVSLLSYQNNLDFKIDKDIQNEMLNSIYNVSDAQLNSVIGKHIYPRTETVQMENDQLYAEYEEVLIRFAAQEIDPEEGNV